jgi:hypothetical protein
MNSRPVVRRMCVALPQRGTSVIAGLSKQGQRIAQIGESSSVVPILSLGRYANLFDLTLHSRQGFSGCSEEYELHECQTIRYFALASS